MYIALLAAIALLDWKFASTYPYVHVMLALVLAMGVLSLVCFLKQLISLKFDFTIDSRYVEADDKFMVSVKNRNRFPFTLLHPKMSIYNRQSKEKEDVSLDDIVYGNTAVYDLKNSKPGNIVITFDEVGFSSLFSLLSGKRTVNEKAEVLIYPHPEEYNDEDIRQVYLPGDRDYVDHRGNDMSEVYDVRPAVETDDMRYLHRSISAKRGENFVRVGTMTRTVIKVYEYIENETFSECVSQIAKIISMCRDHYDENFFISRNSELVPIRDESSLFDLIDQIYKEYIHD